MSHFIQTIHDSINFHLGKTESGYHNPDEIDRELNLESLKVFNDLISVFEETRKISEHLQPLMKSASLTTTGGSIAKPDDFEHAIGMFLTDDDVEVEILTSARFIVRKKHVNKPPSASYPIARMFGANIEMLPITTTKLTIEYFKRPTNADFAYTVVSEGYVFDEGNSVDWEWSDHVSERIVATVLRKFGVPIKDQEVFRYSKSEEPIA